MYIIKLRSISVWAYVLYMSFCHTRAHCVLTEREGMGQVVAGGKATHNMTCFFFEMRFLKKKRSQKFQKMASFLSFDSNSYHIPNPKTSAIQ